MVPPAQKLLLIAPIETAGELVDPDTTVGAAFSLIGALAMLASAAVRFLREPEIVGSWTRVCARCLRAPGREQAFALVGAGTPWVPADPRSPP